MTYSIIMAGGIGSRFWPMSRRARPKHLLPLCEGMPLIEATIKRIEPLTPLDHIAIVTNGYQQRRIQKMLPWLKEGNFIIEPFGKNTAPCIGLSAISIRRHDPESVMIVLPADHIIGDDDEFRSCLAKGVEIAAKGDCLVTLGIPPTRVETGYGYIQRNDVHDPAKKVFQVKTFAEKPNRETARRFIKSGDFYWNSGIFIWRTDLILKLYNNLLPDLYDKLMEIQGSIGKPDYNRVLRRVYRSTRGISIDYGIMERAPSVKVIEGNFGWGDIGSWEEIYRSADKDSSGNAGSGDYLFHNSRNCYINNSNKGFVAAVGLEDIIIVQNGNTTLVCHRDHAQDVKGLVEKLEKMDRKRLL